MGSGLSIMPLPTPNGTATQIVTSPQVSIPQTITTEAVAAPAQPAAPAPPQPAAPVPPAAPAPPQPAAPAPPQPAAPAPPQPAAPVGSQECINLNGTLTSELQNNTPIDALNIIKDITNYTKISFNPDNTTVSISVKVCEFNTSNHALVMYLIDSNKNPILDLSNNNINWTINSVPFKMMNVGDNIQKVGVIPSNSRNTFIIGNTNNFSFVPGSLYTLVCVLSDSIPPSSSATSMMYKITLSPAQGFQNQKKSYDGYYPPNKLVGTEYYPF